MIDRQGRRGTRKQRSAFESALSLKTEKETPTYSPTLTYSPMQTEPPTSFDTKAFSVTTYEYMISDWYLKERAVLDGLYNAFGGIGWYEKKTDNHCWYIAVKCNGIGTITSLELDGVGAKGPILGEIMGLKSLEYLNLRDNQLTGPILVEIGSVTKLEISVLGDNQLTGTIPVEIERLTKLQYLWLDRNRLNRSINEVETLTNLLEISVKENMLSGPLPYLGNMTSLTAFNLTNNRFMGEVSNDLFDHPLLKRLELSSNSLESIDFQYNNTSTLDYLNLAHNKIKWEIPTSFCDKLHNLEYLNLSHNKIRSELPTCFFD